VYSYLAQTVAHSLSPTTVRFTGSKPCSPIFETNNLQDFLISNFRRVPNVVCFLLGNSPASEFYMPTFRNTPSVHFLHICTRGLHVGRCHPQPVSVLRTAPTLSPSFLLAQAIFEPNLFPYKYSNILKPSYSSYLPAYEDGTDGVFRIVGT
jgi:hypothetical protein